MDLGGCVLKLRQRARGSRSAAGVGESVRPDADPVESAGSEQAALGGDRAEMPTGVHTLHLLAVTSAPCAVTGGAWGSSAWDWHSVDTSFCRHPLPCPVRTFRRRGWWIAEPKGWSLEYVGTRETLHAFSFRSVTGVQAGSADKSW